MAVSQTPLQVLVSSTVVASQTFYVSSSISPTAVLQAEVLSDCFSTLPGTAVQYFPSHICVIPTLYIKLPSLHNTSNDSFSLILTKTQTDTLIP